MSDQKTEELIKEFIKDVVLKEHQFMATGTIHSEQQRSTAIAKIFDKYINEMGAK